LREQLTRLGLAQGFDELLCLPHLKGIETFWYQTETVRKVLKQFRGRVLLADEVGLGKTVEAAWCSRSICCAAWRAGLGPGPCLAGRAVAEELETKFDISCVTVTTRCCARIPSASGRRRGSSLRWRSPDARARRAAPGAVVRSRDRRYEAHHLRDRASQSYKLVDGLTKRFLLLLSATPVQNNLIESSTTC